MPSLDGATWFQPEGGPKIEAAPVTMIHFWAVSCHICHETMDQVSAMRDKYAPHGLQTIAFHLPRMEEDIDLEKIKRDVEQFNMTQPIGLDHERLIADRFENEYVPAFFIFNAKGELAFRAAGDKGFAKVETKIREVLGLTD
jgi:thiol-disulfide isomerase/thioredoxin